MEYVLTNGGAVDAICDALWTWKPADGVDAYRADPLTFIADYCCNVLDVKRSAAQKYAPAIRAEVDAWLAENADRVGGMA